MSRAIPKGWSVKSFYQLGRIANGQIDPRLEPYRRMVLVAPDHIESGTGRIAVEYTAEELGAISGKYLVQPNDVIYSKIRPNLQKLALADKACLCSADMYPITAKEGVSPHFLKFVLLSDNFTDFAVSVSARSGMPKINRQEIGAFTTAVPDDPDEQQAIAAALSDADGVVAGLERVIAKKRLIKQGAMQDLLTARRRLPGFSGEWEVKRLGELVTIIMGQSPNSTAYNSAGDGLPLIQGNADIKDRKAITRVFTRQVTKLGRAGDYLMTVRAPVGEIATTDLDVCLGRGVCALRTDQRIVYHIMVSKEPEWAKLSKGSTFDSVNGAEIRAFEVLFPADTAERHAVAQVLDDMDAEIQTLESRLAKARAVKEGMMQNLLTGRIRLV